MNDTTRRFLNTVLERIPESRIIELRLFPAIRQGGIESGVAVLAVEPGFVATPVAESNEAAEEAIVLAVDEAGPRLDASDVEVEIAHPDDAAIAEVEPLDVELEVLDRVAGAEHETLDIADAVRQELERETTLELVAEVIPGEVSSDEGDVPDEKEISLVLEAPDLPADASSGERDDSIALSDILALPSPEGAVVDDNPHSRLAILCARYKLVFKGSERGRWDLEIMHQADAPLDTLDRVIAGVMRRSGETGEPERFTRESLRESLDAPAWVQSA
ncbi:MAG: hypothetical protein ACT4P7_23620 [Gemmatimonadaceae bacterium]